MEFLYYFSILDKLTKPLFFVCYGLIALVPALNTDLFKKFTAALALATALWGFYYLFVGFVFFFPTGWALLFFLFWYGLAGFIPALNSNLLRKVGGVLAVIVAAGIVVEQFGVTLY